MNIIYRGISWLISLLIPIFLLMTAINLLITPVFPRFEYNLPNFPEDPYGFTKDDRIKWSKFAVDYLRNNAGIEYLGDLEFEDGAPLYNDRELRHMVDVKVLVQKMIGAWYLIAGLLIIIGAWAYLMNWHTVFWHSLSRGGMITILLIITILFGVAINFRAIFTGFHRIFFEGNTWLFEYSDTLIRLFPLRFWQDAFIFMGLFTISGALILILLGRKLSKA